MHPSLVVEKLTPFALGACLAICALNPSRISLIVGSPLGILSVTSTVFVAPRLSTYDIVAEISPALMSA